MYYSKLAIVAALLIAAPASAGFDDHYIAGQFTPFLQKAATPGVSQSAQWIDGGGIVWGGKQARFVAVMTRIQLSKKLGGAGNWTLYLGEEFQFPFEINTGPVTVEVYPTIGIGPLISKVNDQVGFLNLSVPAGAGARIYLDNARTLFVGTVAQASLFDWPTWDLRLEFGGRY